LKVNAGNETVASFIALSKSFGGLGNSADAPSTILKSPVVVKNMEALLLRKNSKS
jgi:hypothetical protein